MIKHRIEMPPGLAPFMSALNLVWPIEWFLVPEQATCRVVCDGVKGRHEIWINGDPSQRRPEIVHELCHCFLAERVDPTFSTLRFAGEWNEVSRREPARFSDLALELYYAWSHVDIWVNDIRFARWPALAMAENMTFAEGFVILCQRKEWEVLQSPEALLGLAQYQAERRRRKQEASTFDLSAYCAANGICLPGEVDRLIEFYSNLPHLSFQAEADLKVLETSVQEVAAILRLAIVPRLVFEGQWVWSLG